jgi:hypothetical protein
MVSPVADTGDYVPVGSYPFLLRLAAPADLIAIHYLLSEASAWLRTTKNTDQWNQPWPSRSARDARVRAGVENQATWIAWDGGVPVGTITIAARPNPVVWSRLSSECSLSENAVYAHRLVIARQYAGLVGRHCASGLKRARNLGESGTRRSSHEGSSRRAARPRWTI